MPFGGLYDVYALQEALELHAEHANRFPLVFNENELNHVRELTLSPSSRPLLPFGFHVHPPCRVTSARQPDSDGYHARC